MFMHAESIAFEFLWLFKMGFLNFDVLVTNYVNSFRLNMNWIRLCFLFSWAGNLNLLHFGSGYVVWICYKLIIIIYLSDFTCSYMIFPLIIDCNLFSFIGILIILVLVAVYHDVVSLRPITEISGVWFWQFELSQVYLLLSIKKVEKAEELLHNILGVTRKWKHKH